MPAEIAQERRVGGNRLAYEAQVGELTGNGAQGRGPAREANPAVSARQPDSPAAGGADGGDQRGVRPSRQHRDHGVECGRVGDPQPVDEAGRLAARAQLGVDGATAAVDDHERARHRQAHDGLGRRADGACIFEQLTTKLKDGTHLRIVLNSAPAFLRSRTRR